MIPAAFDYARPATLEEAASLLSQEGGAALLAGGQSLITELKQRRASPRAVIDLNAITELSAIEHGPDGVRIGAMVRQAELLRDATVQKRLPLLCETGAAAGDPMIRRLGTLAGALCEAEPGGDWVAAALALEAEVEIYGKDGTRRMPAADFVTGIKPAGSLQGEIVTAVHLPYQKEDSRSTYRKVKHNAVGWSIASAAINLEPGGGGTCRKARIAVSGAPSHPQRLPALETALTAGPYDAERLRAAIEEALQGLTFRGDHYASADYRRTRLGILLSRTLQELLAA
ncbi:FAD binding domain-containing protein [Tepidicaulis sp.]|uniref:FAD binding domain-containing protein n=1 Tax=Tepidicaulis sp. TaxID=1920809 RepID=UPI003B5B8EE6